MLNVLLECVRIAYSLIEFVLKHVSSPTLMVKSLFMANRKTYSRVPKHLAILYTEKSSICLDALCDLLVESGCAGIKQVSVYDPWSFVQLNKKQIMRRTSTILRTRNKKTVPMLRFSTPGVKEEWPYKSCSVLTVNLLGKDAGKQAIVKACKKLCTNGDPTSIDIGRITSYLAQETISEPEFLLKIGRVESLCGYPPWCLRLTEILSVRRLNGRLSSQQFDAFIDQFCRREQRFGR